MCPSPSPRAGARRRRRRMISSSCCPCSSRSASCSPPRSHTSPAHPPHSSPGRSSPPHLAVATMLAATAFLSCRQLLCRCCRNPRCRGMRKALEFDVQLQTEEAVHTGAGSTVGGADAAMWCEIEALQWKGGQGVNNPDYECLREELRRMALPNGRNGCGKSFPGVHP